MMKMLSVIMLLLPLLLGFKVMAQVSNGYPAGLVHAIDDARNRGVNLKVTYCNSDCDVPSVYVRHDGALNYDRTRKFKIDTYIDGVKVANTIFNGQGGIPLHIFELDDKAVFVFADVLK